MMSVEAATSTPVFLAFLDQVLAPELARRPGATVVMDNLAPHKAAAVRERVEATGCRLRLLPRYSPQGSRMSLASDDPEHVIVVPGCHLAPTASAGSTAA